MVRRLRWPDGVRCPHYDSARVVKQGRDDTERNVSATSAGPAGRRFEDLTDTHLRRDHPPLQVWILVPPGEPKGTLLFTADVWRV